MMPHIIAYTYEAAMHCPDCTAERANVGLLRREPPLHRETDEHGLSYDLVDREGNPVRPVFSTDEIDRPAHCDTCHCEIDP